MSEPVSIKDIRDFFGMTAKDMIKEWKLLSEGSKDQIRQGLADGSLTY